MPDEFDPYFEWLGIPPQEQPASRYRLLGVQDFEANLRVIANAADRQMTYLRTFQTSPNSEASQRLLNEVARAKVCLLSPEKKAAYDQELKRQREEGKEEAAETQTAAREKPASQEGGAAEPEKPSAENKTAGESAEKRPTKRSASLDLYLQRHARPRLQWRKPAILIGAAVVLLAAGVGMYLSFDSDEQPVAIREKEPLPADSTGEEDDPEPSSKPTGDGVSFELPQWPAELPEAEALQPALEAAPAEPGNEPAPPNTASPGDRDEPSAPSEVTPSKTTTANDTSTFTPPKLPADKKKVETAPDPKAGPSKPEPLETKTKEPDPKTPMPRGPQTLVVGTGEKDLEDLHAALQQAQPGDTVLIRHRGPLEFDPVDLSGKTPLTIAGDSEITGDSKQGVDYWPILRQRPAKAGSAVGQDQGAPGLFHGKQLQLTLKKLHLAAAGPGGKPIGAVFATAGGRVELEQCTVTVGVQGAPAEPAGPDVPLLKTLAAETESRVELALTNTFLRGLRLKTCVDGASGGRVHLAAEHAIWAGGAAPWLAAKDVEELRVSLRRCTIYNVPSLLRWEQAPAKRGSASPLVEMAAEKSLFVGPYANSEPFIAWFPGDNAADLPTAAAETPVSWSGAGNIFHRFPGYFRQGSAGTLQNALQWRRLWDLVGDAVPREADPFFRVWPDGYELQETEPRDFQPRWWRNQLRGHRIHDTDLGADHTRLPHSLVMIYQRPPAPTDLAGKPRGVPRILRVHQEEGPYKTLEAAFADLQDEDIIEIADDGPYVPKRDFNVTPGAAVLTRTAAHFTMRSAEQAQPVIVLTDAAQMNLGDSALILLSSRGPLAVAIQGIHFRVQTRTAVVRLVMEFAPPSDVPLPFFRCDSCSFADYSPTGRAHLTEGAGEDNGGRCVFSECLHAGFLWFENDVFFPVEKGISTVRRTRGAGNAAWLSVYRNCLSDGPLSLTADYWKSGGQRVVRCTVAGSEPLRSWTRSEWFMLLEENLVLNSGKSAFDVRAGHKKPTHPFPAMRGAKNVLYDPLVPRLAKDAKERLHLPPGSLITGMPSFEGPSTPKDPYRRYRLKPRTPPTRMAADGGPVGVRFEYLPDLPALPKAFFRQ